MKILVTGKNGQLGFELARVLGPLGEVHALDRAQMDLAQANVIVSVVRDLRPDVIVNAAAYTAVDKAQSEIEYAQAVNARAPGILAEEARRLGALLLHYSTDYVFDGQKAEPYLETDAPNPLGVYGRSKLEGERAIQASGCRHFILRTSWVYGARGANFLLTMLRLSKERPELRVVDDQIGAPTWCRSLADISAAFIEADAARETEYGLYHCSDGGSTSWCGFAREILRQAHIDTPIQAIGTADYPTAAKRPKNSMLNNSKRLAALPMPQCDWRASLRACMAELRTAEGDETAISQPR